MLRRWNFEWIFRIFRSVFWYWILISVVYLQCLYYLEHMYQITRDDYFLINHNFVKNERETENNNGNLDLSCRLTFRSRNSYVYALWKHGIRILIFSDYTYFGLVNGSRWVLELYFCVFLSTFTRCGFPVATAFGIT